MIHRLRRLIDGIAGRVAAGVLFALALLAFLAALGVFGPAGRTRLAATGLYLAGGAAAALLGYRTARARRFGSAALAALLAGGAVRLALAWVAPLTFDLHSYGVVVDALRRGDVVYEATNRYNYSPVWWHVLSAADTAARAAGVSPNFGFRVVAMLGDALVALGLLLHGRLTATRRRAVARAVLWFTNPVPLAVSAFAGQFDSLAIGLYVLALALAAKGRPHGATLVPALLVGSAVAVKQIVVVFAGAFLGFSKSRAALLRDAAASATPFVLLVLPYLAAVPEPVVRNVLSYASQYGLWGWYGALSAIGAQLPFPPAFVSYAALLLGGALAYRLVRQGDDGLRAGRLAAVVFCTLTPGWSAQMLLWPLAFAPERRDALPASLYTLFGLGFWAALIRIYRPSLPALFLAWGALVFWAVRLLPALRRGASRGMNPHGA
jgi:hypothetical protein